MSGPLSSTHKLQGGLAGYKGSMQITAQNVAGGQVEGTTRKDVSLVDKTSGLGVYTPVIKRDVNLDTLGVIRGVGSKVDTLEATSDIFALLEAAYNDLPGGGVPVIVDSISKLETAFKAALDNPSSNTHKAMVVEAANVLASEIDSRSDMCYQAMEKAQDSVSSSVSILNSKIGELQKLNTQIKSAKVTGSDTSILLDQRDLAVFAISSIIEVKDVYDIDGRVSLRSRDIFLLDTNHHAEFTYQPTDSSAVRDGAATGAITYHRIMSSTGEKTFSKDLYTPGKDLLSFPSGKIKGALDAYVDVAPKILNKLNGMAFSIAEHMNATHNQGVSFAGRDEILCAKSVDLNAMTHWAPCGKVRFASLDSEGRAPKYKGLDMQSVLFDIGGFSNLRSSGEVSVKEITDEIQALHAPSLEETVGLGEVPGEVATHLVADMKAVITEDVPNQISFDFQLTNTSIFGSKFEVLEVDGANVKGDLPSAFDIEAGTITRTHKTITLDKIGEHGVKDINVKVRVIGENGKVSEGNITFQIDFDNKNVFGTRISGVPQVANQGDMINTHFDSKSILDVSLVDESGQLSKSSTGKLLFKSKEDGLNLAVQEEGSSTNVYVDGLGFVKRSFKSFLGMGDIFILGSGESYARDIGVREDLIQNPSKLATATLSRAPKNTRTETVGSSVASRDVEFTSVNSEDYDDVTITISGIQFTLKNGPAANSREIDVSTGDTSDAIATIIKEHIEKDAALNNLLSFSIDGSTIGFSAITPGVDGNNIEINIQGNGFDIVNGSDIAHNLTVNLEGGTNKDDAAEFITSSGFYTYKASSLMLRSFVNLFKSNLQDFFAPGQERTLLNMGVKNAKDANVIFADIEMNLKLRKSTLDLMTSEYKQKFGIDPDASAAKMAETANAIKTLSAAMRMILEMYQDIIAAIR